MIADKKKQCRDDIQACMVQYLERGIEICATPDDDVDKLLWLMRRREILFGQLESLDRKAAQFGLEYGQDPVLQKIWVQINDNNEMLEARISEIMELVSSSIGKVSRAQRGFSGYYSSITDPHFVKYS